jgi:hypothetical protein
VADAERWAAGMPVPCYAIDDQTAIEVTDGAVEVVSEGHWKLFSVDGRTVDRWERAERSPWRCAGRSSGANQSMQLMARSGWS